MVYHLATSDNVVVDTYYAFLSASNFKQGVLCTQLWHAAGAMKKFALLDKSLDKRPALSIKRFEHAYHRFTHVVAGSEEMGTIFSKCFNLPKDRMLYTGVPRTDLFYNEEKQAVAIRNVFDKYPSLEGCKKKIILYAPTFRDEQMTVSESALNIFEMYDHLKDDYILLIKTHPSVKNKIDDSLEDFVLNVSDYSFINDLLLITDILVTDYSSVPFEFSFLNRPIIFYAYDLEDYSKSRGTWKDYKLTSPGPVAHTTEEVTSLILKNQFNLTKIQNFKHLWNNYSDGHSSDKIVAFFENNRLLKIKKD